MLKNIAIAMLSLSFIFAGPAKTKGKTSIMPGSKGKTTKPFLGKKEANQKPLYKEVAQDLLSKKHKKKLSKAEKKALEAFVGKKSMNSQAKRFSIKFLESAMKKHDCFVPLSRKTKNMTQWPKVNAKAKWFKLVCDGGKPGKDKPSTKPGFKTEKGGSKYKVVNTKNENNPN